MTNAQDEAKRERYWLAGGRKALPTLTAPGMSFATDHSRLLDLAAFIQLGTTSRVEEAVKRAAAASSPKDAAAIHAEIKPLVDELIAHVSLMHEFVLTRTIDNFLTYIAELLALIYKTRPEMLKSSEPERLEFILQHSSMDELREAIAERHVERLSYKGLRDLSDYIEAQMKFSLFEKPDELAHAALLVEYRNLLVHNRGIVSAAAVRRFPQLRESVNKRIPTSYKHVQEYRRFMENAAFDIDVRATQKFGLRATQVPEPPADLVE
jgi:hypothetical protein